MLLKSMVATRLLKLDRDRLSFRDRLIYSFSLFFLRIIWLFVDFIINRKVAETDDLTSKLSLADNRTLSAVNYKLLRLRKDKLLYHLEDIRNIKMDFDGVPDYMRSSVNKYIGSYQKQLDVLNTIFGQRGLDQALIDGFHVIDQDEAWNTRTTAYDYAT